MIMPYYEIVEINSKDNVEDAPVPIPDNHYSSTKDRTNLKQMENYASMMNNYFPTRKYVVREMLSWSPF